MKSIAVVTMLVACKPKDGVLPTDTGDPTGSPPEVYEFTSRFTEGSSVDYAGQTLRHLLAYDLVEYVEELTERIDTGYFPADGEVEAALAFYFDFDSATSGSLAHGYVSDPPTLQEVYDDVSSGRNLAEKIAGNDEPELQHRDWSTEFRGWTPATTPEGLVRTWFAELDAAAVDRANGVIPLGPDGTPLADVAVSADGVHRAELLQKFLYGALSLSQGADDYLDDNVAGKGLLSGHAEPAEEGSAYSDLEHAWDEGFGWFGVGRDALAWGDELLGGDAYADTFAPDGAIDLLSEVSWGVARYSAQRDLASVAATDFDGDVQRAFLAGRALLASTEGELAAGDLDELRGHRDDALAGWEKVLGASAVHYVNETLVDLAAIATEDYSFASHAGHWSELKGLALAFQFNPHSAMDEATFDLLHEKIGARPVLPDADPAELDAYRTALLEARDLLADTFGFATENLGDDDGLGGW